MATVETASSRPSRRSRTTSAHSRSTARCRAGERTMVGPFIFVDEFGPARLPAGQGMDVRPHPHINLATVTYLFDGAIEHRDSIGSHAVIEPGAINLMTAGRGIVHSERSPQRASAGGPEPLRHADLARASRRRRGDRAGVRSCAGEGLPLVEDGGAQRAGADGHLVGRDGGDAAAFADDLCRHRAGRGRLACRSTRRPTSAR